MNRRQWMTWGLGAAALTAMGGVAVIGTTPGWANGRLSDDARAVFRACAPVFLAGVLPHDGDARDVALQRLLDNLDTAIEAMPAHVQNDLSQLLLVLASAPGRHWFAAVSSPWTQATAEQVEQGLTAMRFSSVALRQQAYHALHDLTGAACFAGNEWWSMLGYPGPVAV